MKFICICIPKRIHMHCGSGSSSCKAWHFAIHGCKPHQTSRTFDLAYSIMHAIKGSWVGQTFALSRSNESGGRKSRIRRSEEESKGMVELFIIKMYQSLNNGNFPSLNLTHKEVGGSFYTVREIVREIIQENRVFGPAKFLPAEQDFHECSHWLADDNAETGQILNASFVVVGNPESDKQEVNDFQEIHNEVAPIADISVPTDASIDNNGTEIVSSGVQAAGSLGNKPVSNVRSQAETNLLWSAFQAFISAFVKFWSEQ
ncbi:unnamed protein product [Linum trigynum]|uniref:AT3G52170-like helix-turn-helix domain-containing protein n=1 Tax=Linum trigynum TaxID=586398 RepID=A0AAV2EMJ1_9ROSI